MLEKRIVGRTRTFRGPRCVEGSVVHLQPAATLPPVDQEDPRWGPWEPVWALVPRPRPVPRPLGGPRWTGTPNRPRLPGGLRRP